MKKRQLVIIDWIDSYNRRGWSNLGDVRESVVPLKCQTVGWVAAKDKSHISVYASVADHEADDGVQTVHGHMTIPLCSVKKIRGIKGVE